MREMSASSAQLDERANKILSAILRGLAAASQVKVAERLGVVESTVSRMKDDECVHMARFLGACSMKVVPEHFQCEDPAYIAALHLMARKHLEAPPQPTLEQDWDKPAT